MSKKNTFHGTSWENLEDRQLLNAAGLGRLAQRSAQIAPLGFGRQGGGIQAASRFAGQNALRGRGAVIPQGQISTDYTAVRPNAAVNPTNNQLGVQQIRRAQVPQTSPPAAVSTNYPLNTAYLGIGATPQSPSMNGRISSIQPRAYAQVGGMLQPVNGLNYQLPQVQATPSNATTTTTGSLAASTSTPALPIGGGSMGRMMSATADGTIATDMSIAPMPFDMMEGAVLSPGQVATLKEAATALATNHTLGADATKDKAAVDSFQKSLDDLAQSVWTQVNVTTTASAVAMKDAAAAFAENYTGGADMAKDQAAWKAFNTALGTFTRSIKNPNAPEMPQPDGPMNDGPWLTMPMMMAGGNIKYLASGILDGQPVNRDDLNGIKTAVDTFAANYTSGVDKSKDMAAGEKMLNSIGEVMGKRWERLAPPEVRDMMAANAAVPYAEPGSIARAPMSMAMNKMPMPPHGRI